MKYVRFKSCVFIWNLVEALTKMNKVLNEGYFILKSIICRGAFIMNFQKKKLAYIFFPLALLGLAKKKNKKPINFIAAVFIPTVAVTKDVIEIVIDEIDNFDTVEKGNLYRSAQLSPKKLRKVIQEHGIKTIINLRGVNSDQDWWQKEREVSHELGVEFHNISMSAKSFPRADQLLRLLDLYDNASRPLYIHCKAGADRTGEAAAIYVLDQMGKSKKDALKQLRLKYHHIKSKYPKKRKLIKIWQGRDWIKNGYYEQEVFSPQELSLAAA